VKKVTLPLSIAAPGYHTLTFWAVDPGVVLERIVLSHGQVLPSYLGPPESLHPQSAKTATPEVDDTH
jgi:hypothetical protein